MLEIELTSNTGLALRRYWEGLATNGIAPSRQSIDPLDMPHLLPNIYLIDIETDPLDFRYRVLGTQIVARSVADYTGRKVSDLPGQKPPSVIWTLFQTAYETQKPSCMAIPLLKNPDASVEIQALPLSSDGQSIDKLLGSVVFPERGGLRADDQVL